MGGVVPLQGGRGQVVGVGVGAWPSRPPRSLPPAAAARRGARRPALLLTPRGRALPGAAAPRVLSAPLLGEGAGGVQAKGSLPGARPPRGC